MPHLMLAALDPLGVVMTVIGLGALIFFHELGHFVACRLTGTRVEAFSIGFGPEIFGWVRGNTRYRVAVIPLGGYVKMAAENPGEERTDAPDEFPNKSFLQRLFIMSNGVIFNVLLALVLFIWGFRVGVPFPRSEIGDVETGGAAWEAGLQTGDVVTQVNGRPILGFDDLGTEVAFSDHDEALDLTVERGGKTIRVAVVPRYSEQVGMPVIGVSPVFDPEMKGVVEGSPLAAAGGKRGDRILAVDGRPIRQVRDVLALVNRAAGTAPGGAKEVTLSVEVRRETGGKETLTVPVPLLEQPQIGIYPHSGNVVKRVAEPADRWIEPGDMILAVNNRPLEDLRTFRELAAPDKPARRIDLIRKGQRMTLRVDRPLTEKQLLDSVAGDLDITTNRVAPRAGMPAARAGLKAGDRVVRIGTTKITNFEELRKAVYEGGMKPLAMTVERGQGERIDLTIQPVGRAKYGLLGYETDTKRVLQKETNIVAAVRTGWYRSRLAMRSVVLTIRSLLSRRVSARVIGGPITLARVTYQLFDVGWGRYFYILALISVNLAVLNILPIPVLDGGQIMLLCAEKLRGKPLPDRVVGYLQVFGLLLILGLLVLALRNDIVGLLN